MATTTHEGGIGGIDMSVYSSNIGWCCATTSDSDSSMTRGLLQPERPPRHPFFSLDAMRLSRIIPLLTRWRDKWNGNRYASPTISFFGAARDRDGTPPRFDKLFGHPQANACTQLPLRGEEWLEDLS
jgi:hypothetical protein